MIRLREFEKAARPVMESLIDDIITLAYAFPRKTCACACACSGACMDTIVKETLDKLDTYYGVVYGYNPP